MNDSRMKNKRAARTIVLLSKEDKVIKLSYIIPPSDELRFERSRRGKRADDNNRRRCDGRNSLNNSIESGSNHDYTLQKA